MLRIEQDVALRDRATESLRKITGQELPANAEAWTEFLHKSGKEGLAKKETSWDSFLRLISWQKKGPNQPAPQGITPANH